MTRRRDVIYVRSPCSLAVLNMGSVAPTEEIRVYSFDQQLICAEYEIENLTRSK